MSLVVKRSVAIRGHRTSFSLEQPFFDDLLGIATARDLPLARLIAEIDATRPKGANLSSAVRLYVLDWAKRAPRAVDDPAAVAGRPGGHSNTI